MTLWIWLGFSVLIYTLLSISELYALSSGFPAWIRRRWIKWRHPEDYEKWPEYQALLNNRIAFFKTITEREKEEFLVRLTDLKNRVNISGRDGITIDLQKEVLVCAAMTQITFGYSDFRLNNFRNVVLFPDIFHSNYADADVKGLTVANGCIFLSWQDFEAGYENSSNCLNLGLHEFAHAFKIERSEIFETEDFETFTVIYQQLMKRIATTGEEDPLFRRYGFSNTDEFWAVSVEVFFEQPVVFKNTYPNLYKLVTRFLRQDMAARLTPNQNQF